MNVKKAKVLRKLAGFHPKDPRPQIAIKTVVSKTETRILRVENDPESSRARYRNLKRDARN